MINVKEIGNLAIMGKDNKPIKIKDLSNKNKIRLIGQLFYERAKIMDAYSMLKLKTEWDGTK